MPVRAIVGAQWGDEGKGKITDLLAQDADMVIRFGGGSNAGHTVVNGRGKFALHSIPSGIFNPHAISLIGTGAVVDFEQLTGERADLDDAGIDTSGLRISSRAHVVMPYHVQLDGLSDDARGKESIGTTRRGIGPAYADKAERLGIQAADILEPVVLRRKLTLALPDKNRKLQGLYGKPAANIDDLLELAEGWRTRFGHLIADQVELVSHALDRDLSILLEGQLGALRDLDWGTYPYVTSSSTIAGGGGVGGGIPPRCIDQVLGVVKAYTSAVGTGPVPTELVGDAGNWLREAGDEFGVTTGRARRVGWFDAVATRYAHRLNRFTGIAVTKLDVLDGASSLKICTGYRRSGQRLESLPSTSVLEDVTPEYEEVAGWDAPTKGATSWAQLPEQAQNYIKRIQELVGAEVTIVSVGPGRDETIFLDRVI